MNNSVNQLQDPGGPWDIGMERIPLVTFDGDLVTIENFRNFRYEYDGFNARRGFLTLSV